MRATFSTDLTTGAFAFRWDVKVKYIITAVQFFPFGVLYVLECYVGAKRFPAFLIVNFQRPDNELFDRSLLKSSHH